MLTSRSADICWTPDENPAYPTPNGTMAYRLSLVWGFEVRTSSLDALVHTDTGEGIPHMDSTHRCAVRLENARADRKDTQEHCVIGS